MGESSTLGLLRVAYSTTDSNEVALRGAMAFKIN